jgi:hypothetical protein
MFVYLFVYGIGYLIEWSYLVWQCVILILKLILVVVMVSSAFYGFVLVTQMLDIGKLVVWVFELGLILLWYAYISTHTDAVIFDKTLFLQSFEAESRLSEKLIKKLVRTSNKHNTTATSSGKCCLRKYSIYALRIISNP